ncbi:tetratricopeptide repeat protein [Chryseolinea soli]|uniref:histidine kinase n=1 Tax=Chryseolinea soli TaxID=2321403 RepID=A0A385SQK4_9BACT|nr:tetratricopeptide repeat protein [Chryseolinea soli]AYB33132.1 response regulator [Chryseolinea soli]
MKKIAWLYLSLSLMSGLPAWGQNKKLDSLYHQLNQHPKEDTVRVQLLTGICYYEYTSDNERNKLHATEALRISRRLHYTFGIGTALKYMALYYWVIGDYDPATEYAIEMLQTFETSSNVLGLSQAYNLLGLIHERSQDFEKAKYYYTKALEIRQKAGLKRDVAYSFNSLGSLYYNLSKFDEAQDYFQKSLKIREEIKDEDGLSQTYGNLAVIFMKKKEYTAAVEYYQKALAILEKLGNKYRTMVNYTNLGEVYIHQKKYGEAEHYLKSALAMATTLRHKEVLAEVYDKLTLLETESGHHKQALAYLELKHNYLDSIYTEKKAKQIAEVEARYQTEKKDQTILALEQQKEIQNLKQLYLILGLLAMTVICVTIYFLQRSHNRKVSGLLENQKSLNLRLQEADQLKSNLFANISHEFRTPLTLILTPIEDKLASPTLAAGEKESFQLVARNANRLLSLVNQLLDLTKLEAKKMELVVQQGDLKKFLTVVSASFDSLAENKKIRFEKSIAVETRDGWFDADKLEKIINNVLFNAFKFTTEGGQVTFAITQSPQTNDLEIAISDTGKGIPEEEQQHIFSPFYQSRHAADDGFGTGLGLSLVKELVDLYQGNIQLSSTLHQGTTLRITLPQTKDRLPAFTVFKEETAMVDHPATTAASLQFNGEDIPDEVASENEAAHEETVLIVEDNDDLRNYIASTLQGQFITLTAKDGAEGYALAIERIPDLVISDVMMPNLDGIGLTEILKTDERTSHIPVVLLTAKADPQSKIDGLQTGADDYLSKPFSSEELRIRATNLIEQRKKLAIIYRAGYSAVAPPPKEPSLDDKFLMKAKQLVEDNIADPGFGVEKMADNMHLSRAQLFRKLKAIAGLSPNEFINEIRLQKAAQLILSKADTLTQISYAVGFNEQSYFAKRFRKKFGVAPSEYSKRNATQKA